MYRIGTQKIPLEEFQGQASFSRKGVSLKDISVDELCRAAKTEIVVLKVKIDEGACQVLSVRLESTSLDRLHSPPGFCHPALLRDVPMLRRLEETGVVIIDNHNSDGALVDDYVAFPGPRYNSTTVVGVKAPTWFRERYFAVEPA